MSTRDLHEYVPGQFTQLTRYIQEPAGADAVSILDVERVRLAGYDIELWDASSGGVQLIESTDYTLEFKDQEISDLEGFDVNAGYMIINPAYQAVNLYLTAKIVGGYTFRPYRPQMLKVSVDTVLTMDVIADMAVMVDTTAGDVIVTLPEMSADVLAENSQVTIIPTGGGTVIITHSTFLQDVRIKDTAAAFIYAAGTWLQLGGSGGGTGGGMAVGEVAWWPGAGIPDRSKLVCDGALYNPAGYPSLFAKLGTLYGGDGITTFGVPNLQGIFPGAQGTQGTHGGAEAIGSIREDSIESHTHPFVGSALPTHFHTSGFSTGDEPSLFCAFGYRASPTASSFSRTTDDGVYGAYTDVVSAGTPAGSVNAQAGAGAETRPATLVGRWLIQAYDTVQEVPADPSLVRDWVMKFLQETTPPASVVNAWGSGIFYISIGYSFNGTPGRATMTLFVNPADGFNRYALASMDFAAGDSWIGSMYDAATNSFKPTSFGPDYTGLAVIAVYKWEAVSLGTLNPPVDGWETVFYDLANTAEVTNAWGTGAYEILVDGDISGLTGGTCFYMALENLSGVSNSASWASSATDFVRAVYDNSTNRFRLGVTGVPAAQYIKRIRKFNGLLHVLHDYRSWGDDSWTEKTSFLNGWTGFCNYIKRNGVVTINLVVNGASATGNEIMILPEGYRPDTTLEQSTPSRATVIMTPSGSIQSDSRMLEKPLFTYPVL